MYISSVFDRCMSSDVCDAGHVYSLHAWSSCMFASGSQDKTARLWDLRAPAAVNVIPSPSPGYYTSCPSHCLLAALVSLGVSSVLFYSTQHAVLATVAFPSVCLSVTHQYCVKVNEHSMMPSSLMGS